MSGAGALFAPTLHATAPGKLNVKTGFRLILYFGFSMLSAFSRLLFFAFLGIFSDDLGF